MNAAGGNDGKNSTYSDDDPIGDQRFEGNTHCVR